MRKLKQAINLETAFGQYVITDIIGEGGSGRVYAGTGLDNSPVAVKVLASDRITSDKRRRFKNEIAFLLRNKHQNIVAVIDHGVATHKSITGPFYVMRRYETNLRDLMDRGISPDRALSLFAGILDGVEAAHLLGAVHRDLKPENILVDTKAWIPAIADFGIASFTDDIVSTAVETAPGQKLANFQYAAPEQRSRGREVGVPADIYALGLMLNELFTGNVPHGTEYQLISSVHNSYAYLDSVVAQMIRQSAADRYRGVAELKGAISHHHAEFENIQKLSVLSEVVIPAGEVDDPLALNVPKITDAYWADRKLTITLDRPVNEGWVRGLHNMGNYTSAMGVGPERFQFRGNQAFVGCDDTDAQRVITFFKDWLPRATQRYKHDLETELKRQAYERAEKLKRERAAEEQRLRVNRSLQF